MGKSRSSPGITDSDPCNTASKSKSPNTTKRFNSSEKPVCSRARACVFCSHSLHLSLRSPLLSFSFSLSLPPSQSPTSAHTHTPTRKQVLTPEQKRLKRNEQSRASRLAKKESNNDRLSGANYAISEKTGNVNKVSIDYRTFMHCLRD